MTTIVHIFVILTFLSTFLSALGGFLNETRYSVFLGDGPLTSLLAYTPPLPKSDLRSENGEPRILDNEELPLMLCGASIIGENQLLTSIRCSPSIASKTVVYVFPAKTTDFLSQLDKAKVLEKVVTEVLFKHSYTLPSGTTYRNVAIVNLNDNYFSPLKNLLENNKVTDAPSVSLTTGGNLVPFSNFETKNQTMDETEFLEENYDIHDTDYEVYYEYVDVSSEDPNEVEGEVALGTDKEPHEEETFSAVEILDLTSSLIDVATVAEEAQQNSSSNQALSSSHQAPENNNQYKTTTPLCTLREEYEEVQARTHTLLLF